MSLREIARTLADFRAEFRSQIAAMMRTDVYHAEQAALVQRIATVEKGLQDTEEEKRQTRRLVMGSLLTCVATVVAALLIVGLN